MPIRANPCKHFEVCKFVPDFKSKEAGGCTPCPTQRCKGNRPTHLQWRRSGVGGCCAWRQLLPQAADSLLQCFHLQHGAGNSMCKERGLGCSPLASRTGEMGTRMRCLLCYVVRWPLQNRSPAALVEVRQADRAKRRDCGDKHHSKRVGWQACCCVLFEFETCLWPLTMKVNDPSIALSPCPNSVHRWA